MMQNTSNAGAMVLHADDVIDGNNAGHHSDACGELTHASHPYYIWNFEDCRGNLQVIDEE